MTVAPTVAGPLPYGWARIVTCWPLRPLDTDPVRVRSCPYSTLKVEGAIETACTEALSASDRLKALR